MSKVWYITGASKGLGLSLVNYLLAQGEQVAATSRSKEELAATVGQHTSFLPLQVDLTKESDIAASITEAHRHFGQLDVIVNNAGFGIAGAIEELSTEEITRSIQINLLANIHVIRYAMPHLRKQRSGHIINISSIGGFTGALGWGMYSASKFAVIGYTETLAQDIKELGIKATVVAPGGFRTSFLTADALTVAANRIEDYTAVHASHQRYFDMDGKQLGDPQKAARVLYELVADPEPPVVLFIGSDAYSRASQKIDQQRENLEKYKTITLSTDF